MSVLITNDDGINSEGLTHLRSFAEKLNLGDVWVVAPSGDRSANSHIVTLNKPMYLSEISEKTYILDGSPADCVIVALDKVFGGDNVPDFILSGVNIGTNVGIDKIYSGTVAAAMEGMFFGIPAIAFSQLYTLESFKRGKINWQMDDCELVSFIRNIIRDRKFFDKSILSINLPEKKSLGIKFIEQGSNKMSNFVSHRRDHNALERNRSEIIIHATDEPTFCESLDEGYITITPVGYNLTNYKMLEYLNENYSQ